MYRPRGSGRYNTVGLPFGVSDLLMKSRDDLTLTLVNYNAPLIYFIIKFVD